MLVGLSHKTAPVEVRERLSIPQKEWNAAAERLCAYSGIREASILSTCNRFEVYVVPENHQAVQQDVMAFLSEKSGMATEDLQPYLYFRPDTEATWHLFRTSAGLDSLVLGEGQILSQVKAMHQHAIAPASEDEPAGSAGKVLGQLLNSAVEAGKAARAETKIAQGGVSISSAAVELAGLKAQADCGKPLEELRCTVAGAGTMGRLVLTHLASRGIKKVTLVSRSQSRAHELAAEYPTLEIEVKEKDTLHATLAESDVAVMAVSTRGELLITKEHFATAPARETPLMLIDISVPRSISADCSEVDGVVAYDVDALQEAVEENTRKRHAEVVKVEELLEQRKEKFLAFQSSLEYLDSIKMLRGKADEVRTHLVEDAFNGPLSELTPKQRKGVESMTNDIVNKIMHRPTKYLREHVSDENHEKLTVEQVENVFQLKKTWRQTAQELRDRYEPVFITKATQEFRDRYEPKEIADAARNLRVRSEPQSLQELQAMFEPKEFADFVRELREENEPKDAIELRDRYEPKAAVALRRLRAQKEPKNLKELQERFEPAEVRELRVLRARFEPSWEDVQAMFEPKEIAEAARELRALYEPQSEAGAKSGLEGLRTRHVGELDVEHFQALNFADQSGFHTADKIRWFCEEVRSAALDKVMRGQLKKLSEEEQAAVAALSEDVCNALIDPVMSYMHSANSVTSPRGAPIDDRQLADIFELELPLELA